MQLALLSGGDLHPCTHTNTDTHTHMHTSATTTGAWIQGTHCVVPLPPNSCQLPAVTIIKTPEHLDSHFIIRLLFGHRMERNTFPIKWCFTLGPFEFPFLDFSESFQAPETQVQVLSKTFRKPLFLTKSPPFFGVCAVNAKWDWAHFCAVTPAFKNSAGSLFRAVGLFVFGKNDGIWQQTDKAIRGKVSRPSLEFVVNQKCIQIDRKDLI